jgi:ABC-type multidrug transport system ATPase subunit
MLGAPEVIILDEPTTGVDLMHRTALWDVLRRRSATGTSVLYSTHSLEDAAIADRAVVLVAGQIVWSGQLPELAKFAPEAEGHVTHVADPVALGLLALWARGEDERVIGKEPTS